MTDYQKRIADLRARITPVAEYHDLVGLHNELFDTTSHLRIGSRWGDYTSYTVTVREPDALALTDGKIKVLPNGQGRYRIEFGAKHGTTHARLEYWKPKPLNRWEPWDGPEERAWEWLRQHQPAAEALLEIDLRLLAMLGEKTTTSTNSRPKGITAGEYRKALEDNDGNLTRAAASLGVQRSTVAGMAQRHGFSAQDSKGRPIVVGYNSMTPEERREYNRQKKRESLARKKNG